jgi:hypothetical protein
MVFSDFLRTLQTLDFNKGEHHFTQKIQALAQRSFPEIREKARAVIP